MKPRWLARSAATRWLSGPALVPDRGEQVAGDRLQLDEVVARLALLGAQLDVRPPGLLGGRGAFLVQAPQLVVQAEDRLRSRRRRASCAPGTAGSPRLAYSGPRCTRSSAISSAARFDGGSGLSSSSSVDPEDARELLQFAELEFAFAVLDDRHLRGRPAEFGGERVERQPAIGAELPDAAADGEGIEHLFIVEVFCTRKSHDSILTP